MAQTNDQRREVIEQRGRNQPPAEAVERKARSVARLKSENVPTIDHLPVIEASWEAKTRPVDEVAKRAIAVCLTAVKGEGLEQEIVNMLVKRHGADKFFSPAEAAFIKSPDPSREDRVKFSWRYEDYWVLLWALGYVDTLDRPDKICDVSKAVGTLRDRTTDQLIEDAKLRPLAEILDQADLIYRYHWAITDARVKNKDAPAKLEGGVVMERHYALNWLIGYMGQEWDHVSTDT